MRKDVKRPYLIIRPKSMSSQKGCPKLVIELKYACLVKQTMTLFSVSRKSYLILKPIYQDILSWGPFDIMEILRDASSGTDLHESENSSALSSK